MGAFATGRGSNAICDRCGMKYPYLELANQTVAGVETNLKVCWRCMDVDHEQYQIGRVVKSDAQALHDPRPEQNLEELRGLFGWNPALGQTILLRGGTVQVP